MYSAIPLVDTLWTAFIGSLLLVTLGVVIVIFMSFTCLRLDPRNANEKSLDILWQAFFLPAVLSYGVWAILWLFALAMNPPAKVYKNEKVVVQLVETTPYTATYMTPEGRMTIRKAPGKEYPKSAIMYKN